MPDALLALEDGSLFYGQSIGILGQTVGEVVFNTAMTGYQEVLSDPSYAEQIVTFTYPHIGNVGCNQTDQESTTVWAKGLVIRDMSLVTSNWRSESSLQSYLEKQQVIGIADIDTRRLTRLLRDKGALKGCIQTGALDAEQAVAAAKQFAGLQNLDLAKEVTTTETYTWTEGSHSWQQQPAPEATQHWVIYDFGVKRNILRMLVDRGCRLTVVPAKTPAADVLALKPDAVMLSNGPGDPAACDYAMVAVKQLMAANMPLLGICLGHQILCLALGAKTTKMKFGHHGANHPVKDCRTDCVMVTSQNHGFTVAEESLPNDLTITHRSLFDNTIQGVRHQHYPAMSFQGHPEASPGPHDLAPLFDEFVAVARNAEPSKKKILDTEMV